MVILNGGNVGIGVASPVNKLEVCGTIRAKEVRVETGWCDYVFSPSYKLRSLEEVSAYIAAHKHLPDVTSGDEIEKNGLLVGNTMQDQMRKIEELTLYTIEQNEKLKEANAKINTQEGQLRTMQLMMEQMNTRLNALEATKSDKK